jgi:hypothetical protein
MQSDFGDFLRQLPTGVIALLCTSGLMLAVSFVLIVRARSARARRGLSGGIQGDDLMRFFKRGQDSKPNDDYPDMDLLLDVPLPAPASAAAQPKRSRSGTYDVALPDGRTVEAAELMTIARDLADGSLIIQIGDRAYSHASQIEDPEARRRFLNTLKQLVQLASPAAAPSSSDQPTSPVQPTPVEAAEPENQPALGQPTNNTSPAQPQRKPPPPRADGVMPGDLPKFSTTTPPLTVRGKPAPKEEVPELNIAGAIEAYLQHKISYTPEYAGRSIHVRPSFGGGVKIEVDGMFFDAVDEVSDTTVRQFLTETIEEWQSRQ